MEYCEIVIFYMETMFFINVFCQFEEILNSLSKILQQNAKKLLYYSRVFQAIFFFKRTAKYRHI